jgi:hypothetical protein
MALPAIRAPISRLLSAVSGSTAILVRRKPVSNTSHTRISGNQANAETCLKWPIAISENQRFAAVR